MAHTSPYCASSEDEVNKQTVNPSVPAPGCRVRDIDHRTINTKTNGSGDGKPSRTALANIPETDLDVDQDQPIMSKYVPNHEEFDRLVMELRKAHLKLDELEALIQTHKANVIREKKVTVATIFTLGLFLWWFWGRQCERLPCERLWSCFGFAALVTAAYRVWDP